MWRGDGSSGKNACLMNKHEHLDVASPALHKICVCLYKPVILTVGAGVGWKQEDCWGQFSLAEKCQISDSVRDPISKD